MDCFQTISRLKGSLGHQFLLFIVWLSSFQVAVALQTLLEPQHVSSTSELATPPISGIFGPIEISPAVFPRNPYPALVGNNAVADDCFSDIISILASRGANKTIPTLCSVKSLNLTGGLCPVKDVVNFEKIINTSKLLDACSTVDPLKECCRPICQSAITEAALEMSRTQLTINDNKELVTEHNGNGPLTDCKGVVHSYLSRKLSVDAANAAFRTVSACKVNKVCPLNFTQPLEVIKACRNVAAPSPSCCSSLNTYIAGIQNQMLITNKQAIICATVLGSKLRQGCLLRSLPPDVILDNSTGFSFTCDLNDNIAAPWPSSSSMSTLSLCAPEMSLPALPTSQIKNPGNRGGGELELLVPIFSFFILSALLY
ncbi:GPI-ANCHORED PROTEIN [Salix purpurea]|uniref:GPI-ANCHORED PROTEIN n=1 Tax=Salix purpurea TaxID=77065 RepID=A0A9Q0ZNN6_SALPP|nr:GPI-ANCHORED PROTEIN [Salix purpurea]